MPDAHKNFSVSSVATAPSPATSGTSLVVAAGEGTRFPAAPFNASIWPTASQPTPANAEIVRVTIISTDTFTITRTQEGSSARTVVVGDQIAATVTAKTLTDVEALALANPVKVGGALYYVTTGAVSTSVIGTNQLSARPMFFPAGITIDRIGVEITSTTANAVLRFGIYNDSGGFSPGSLLIDGGTAIAGDTPGNKEKTISQLITVSGIYWPAVVAQVASPTYRVVSPDWGGLQWTSLTASPTSGMLGRAVFVTGVSGALPDPFGLTTSGFGQSVAARVFVRVT